MPFHLGTSLRRLRHERQPLSPIPAALDLALLALERLARRDERLDVDLDVAVAGAAVRARRGPANVAAVRDGEAEGGRGRAVVGWGGGGARA